MTKNGAKSIMEKENKVKNKKCPKCGKKFVNGKVRKSKYVECVSCDKLTHERCDTSKRVHFKFILCQHEDDGDLDTFGSQEGSSLDLGQVHGHSAGRGEDDHDTFGSREGSNEDFGHMHGDSAGRGEDDGDHDTFGSR